MNTQRKFIELNQLDINCFQQSNKHNKIMTPSIDFDHISDVICSYFNIKNIKSKCRKGPYVYSRYIFCQIAHVNLGETQEDVADYLGFANHSSINNYVKKFPYTITANNKLNEKYNYILKDISLIDGLTHQYQIKSFNLMIRYHNKMIKEIEKKKNKFIKSFKNKEI